MNFFTIFLLAILCLGVSVKAYAYLDPGAGSYLFQAIAAVAIGATVSIRLFRQHIKIFFRKIFRRSEIGH
jgi:hypothetical protein